MPIFNRLTGPCFDLCWLRLPPTTVTSSKPATSSTSPTTPPPPSSIQTDECVILLPIGGGNKTKSGIKNQIHIMKLNGQNGFDLITKFDTNDLCCSISGGSFQGHTFFCGSYTGSCILYSLTFDEDNQLCSKQIAEFAIEELKDSEMTMNAILFTKNYLLTGGENGVCYVWSIKRVDENWEIEKVKELHVQTGPIKSFSLHPKKDWVASASDDGTCVIWDLKSLTSIGIIRCSVDGLPGGIAPSKVTTPSKKSSTLKCRGAVFSSDGTSLFTVQCPGIGSSYLIKWGVEEEDLKEGKKTSSDTSNDSNDPLKSKTINLIFSPQAAIKASNVPACRLIGPSSHSVDDPSPILAYGDCEGVVSIYSMNELKLISKDNCHDFPVTGLGVAPRIVLTAPGVDLEVRQIVVSCSADNKLSTIFIKESASWIQQFLSFLVIFLTLILLLLILMKFKQNQEVIVG